MMNERNKHYEMEVLADILFYERRVITKLEYDEIYFYIKEQKDKEQENETIQHI